MSITTVNNTLSTPYYNLLDNGSFEIWQRGSGFTQTWSGANTQTGFYTADRWQATLYTQSTASSITATISREATTIHNGNYSLKFNITSLTGSGCAVGLRQEFEANKDVGGQVITGSVWMNTTLQNFSLSLQSDAGVLATSSLHPGDGAWHQLTVTATMNSSPVYMLFSIAQTGGTGLVTSTGAVYVDGACLVFGTQPVSNYVYVHPQQDLDRCMRYFETRTTYETNRVISHYSAQQIVYQDYAWKVSKATIPTVTLSGAYFELDHLPTTGTGSGGNDTANWTLTAAVVDTEGFRFTPHRSADQTTYPIVDYYFTYTASADY